MKVEEGEAHAGIQSCLYRPTIGWFDNWIFRMTMEAPW